MLCTAERLWRCQGILAARAAAWLQMEVVFFTYFVMNEQTKTDGEVWCWCGLSTAHLTKEKKRHSFNPLVPEAATSICVLVLKR